MPAKDNFSTVSQDYAKFRPTYPPELVEHVANLLPEIERNFLLDSGTGNGQFASLMLPYFKKIAGHDLSANQIASAFNTERIRYFVSPAENLSEVGTGTVDMVTVAQAYHWYDFPEFFKELDRILRPGGIFVVFGYGTAALVSPDAPHTQSDLARAMAQDAPLSVTSVFNDFYVRVTHQWWDAERRHIDKSYSSVPLPWPDMVPTAHFQTSVPMTMDHLYGYLSTWSSVTKMRKAMETAAAAIAAGVNPEDAATSATAAADPPLPPAPTTEPVAALIESLKPLWPPGGTVNAVFPLFLRACRKPTP